MIQHFRPALVLLLLFTALTGLAYPFAIAGVASVAFPSQAGGSLMVHDGTVIGSALIGQNFASEVYFQPRPSATNTPDPADSSKTIDAPYNAANSSGSNLGPTSKALVDRVKAAAEAKLAAGWKAPLPADAFTTSASGLDPEISPQNALAQVPLVAEARGLDEAKLRALVAARTHGRWLGLIGEPRVNVLALNIALDALE
ncbi:potassium-transporting ATPase subunit C [Rhodoblastus sphagnicola]|uniref:Potassium-transporting ATPase KdpC subunit n=1 Tax=Rhodoblastus sphagnicola TaxID=333368 RepID=A0A2S6N9A4_9HYPH|nr:potassium-transporting ATPase subunit KdpC [Rhodoblastus sphagnicola]MBB4196517.1 K+-transporting ATPase ATPase C chain [Rhodoblastus sphagnicola]PPQ31198.1 potassium-transporting ATPase subunit C [Rhodoblastus sphagnicola]